MSLPCAWLSLPCTAGFFSRPLQGQSFAARAMFIIGPEKDLKLSILCELPFTNRSHCVTHHCSCWPALLTRTYQLTCRYSFVLACPLLLMANVLLSSQPRPATPAGTACAAGLSQFPKTC